jgi:hypothetical protein
VSYGRDALYRKIESTDTGSTRHWYHSAGWQVIEERDGPASTDAVVQQHVWSPVHVDAMVLRDRDSDPTTAGLEERLYAIHDANFSVTAVVGEDGSGGWEVKERYVYDPYGSRAVLDAGWPPTRSSRRPRTRSVSTTATPTATARPAVLRR